LGQLPKAIGFRGEGKAANLKSAPELSPGLKLAPGPEIRELQLLRMSGDVVSPTDEVSPLTSNIARSTHRPMTQKQNRG
jgi:hypothetical protein